MWSWTHPHIVRVQLVAQLSLDQQPQVGDDDESCHSWSGPGSTPISSGYRVSGSTDTYNQPYVGEAVLDSPWPRSELLPFVRVVLVSHQKVTNNPVWELELCRPQPVTSSVLGSTSIRQGYDWWLARVSPRSLCGSRNWP